MYRKTITSTDFDGNERTEDLYFHMSEAELLEFEITTPGGISGLVTQLTQEKDYGKIFTIFKDLICHSYGEKSPDGRKFVKSPEIVQNFLSTNAYNELIMGFVKDPKEAARFVNGIVPKNIADRIPDTVTPEMVEKYPELKHLAADTANT